MAAAKHEDGMDILKFFIGVMSLLTIFVAGFAGYNWSAAAALEEQVVQNEEDLRQIEKIAGNADFKMGVARAALSKEIDPKNTDLGRFLTDAATTNNCALKSDVKEGGGVTPGGLVRLSHRIVIERQTLEVIGDYLFYIQAKWPGLKIEEIVVSEVAVKKGEPFAGWQATVLVSIFRPKE
jgi:hypothetical protein